MPTPRLVPLYRSLDRRTAQDGAVALVVLGNGCRRSVPRTYVPADDGPDILAPALLVLDTASLTRCEITSSLSASEPMRILCPKIGKSARVRRQFNITQVSGDRRRGSSSRGGRSGSTSDNTARRLDRNTVDIPIDNAELPTKMGPHSRHRTFQCKLQRSDGPLELVDLAE